MAVHARPAAFEGADGRSYTVAIETDDTGERARPVGAYLLFVRWGGEQPDVTGHIETPFLAWGATAEEATHGGRRAVAARGEARSSICSSPATRAVRAPVVGCDAQ